MEATRPLEGEANNQFELIRDAHHLFYPDGEPAKELKRRLTFLDRAGTVYDKPSRVIHYNWPPLMKKGNAMWRIRLPTDNEGLLGYQEGNVAIRFERTDTRDRYLIEFAPLGGSEANAGPVHLASSQLSPRRNANRDGGHYLLANRAPRLLVTTKVLSEAQQGIVRVFHLTGVEDAKAHRLNRGPQSP